MKAIVTYQTGSTPDMRIEDRPVPQVREGTSLIRMRAATINQLSNTIRTGGFGTLRVPLVLGNEGAGVIEESERFAKGTRVAIFGAGVLGVTEDGLFQERAVVDDWRLMPLPDAMTDGEGATLSMNYLTAFNALTRTARIKPGDVALISGATGAVGTALVQIAAALGARPVALVSSAQKATAALKSGAVSAINWKEEDVLARVSDITNGRGADVALDPAGGDMFSLLFSATRPRAHIVSIGFTAGRKVELDLLSIIGSEKVIEGYSLHADTKEQGIEGLKGLSELAARGVLHPTIDSSWDVNHFEAGYTRLASRAATGAIILKLS